MPTRLLLVDTDIGFMVKLKNALDETGDFAVSIAANVPGAAEHLRLRRHDCALVGFGLPGYDVLEVVRELRSVQPDLPIIVTPETPAHQDRVAHLDVQSSLHKPFTAREAIPHIGSVLTRARRQFETPLPHADDEFVPPEMPASVRDLVDHEAPLRREDLAATDILQQPGEIPFNLDALEKVDLNLGDLTVSPAENLTSEYQEPDGASILDEFAALERAQTDALSPLEMREEPGTGLLDDAPHTPGTHPLDERYTDAAPGTRHLDWDDDADQSADAEPDYPRMDLPGGYGQRTRPPEPAPTRDLDDESAPPPDTARLAWGDQEPAPTRELDPDMDADEAEPDYPRLDVDHDYGQRIKPEEPAPTRDLADEYAASGTAPLQWGEESAPEEEGLTYEVSPPDETASNIIDQDALSQWLASQASAEDDEEPESPVIQLGAPSAGSPSPLDDPAWGGIWNTQDSDGTRLLHDDAGWSDPEPSDEQPALATDQTRPLDQTAPLPPWDDATDDEFGFEDAPADEEDAIRDVLDAMASTPPETVDPSAQDRAFHDLVDSLRTPQDRGSGSARASLEDLLASLAMDTLADKDRESGTSSALDGVLKAIRQGTSPGDEAAIISGESELQDATIGDIIHGLFEPAFEGVLATLAGEEVSDAAYEEPSYEESSDVERPEAAESDADRDAPQEDAAPRTRARANWQPRIPEPPVEQGDSSKYPATSALSAVSQQDDEKGRSEFSLDALLNKIETDLPRTRRPRLKPLPSWGKHALLRRQSPTAAQMSAFFDRMEGESPRTPAPSDAHYESLLEEFENLTPESLIPTALAQESARDDQPPPELTTEAETDEQFDLAHETFSELVRDQPHTLPEEQWADDYEPAEPAEFPTDDLIEDELPAHEPPSFVEAYEFEEVQDSETRPMPVDAGAHLDAAFIAEPEDDDEFYAPREDDRIPPELAAELGELANQLAAAPSRPPLPPEWVPHSVDELLDDTGGVDHAAEELNQLRATMPELFEPPAADDTDFVEVPADTAAMLLSGLDEALAEDTYDPAGEDRAYDADAADSADDYADETGDDDALADDEEPAAEQAPVDPEDEDEVLKEIAVLLTQYSLESSAQAVMLAQPGALVAVSGNLPAAAERHLFELVDNAWQTATDSGALIRFINLPETGEFLLYSTLIDTEDNGDLSLSMVFHVDTPVRLIRRQAQRLSESLALVPEEESDEVPAASTQISRPTFPKPPAGLATAVQEQEAQRAAEAKAAADAPARPVEDTPAYTAYTCAWLPSDPLLELRGDLADALAEWIDDIAHENTWEVEDKQIGPDTVILTLRVPEKLLADTVITRLMDDTSARSSDDFPESFDASPSLWTDGYYLVSPPRPLSDREIGRFITYQRQSQMR